MASFRASSLLLPGFVVQDIVCEPGQTSIVAHHERSFSNCPSCGTPSQRVHSRYRRSAMDLPLCGRRVRLTVMARRFRCAAPLCARRIFAERFPDEALAPWARRTARLEALVHHLGLALGGRPAASFAKRLVMPVSNDTLLRVVRRRAHAPTEPLRIIGIDDWAWCRNHR